MADDSKIEVLISAQADALKDGLDEAKAAVAASAGAMGDSLKDMSGATSQVQGAFSTMASQARSQLQGLSAQVQSAASGITESLRGITAPLSGIAGAVAAVAAVTGIFAGLIGTLKSAVSTQDEWVRDSLQIARVTGQTAEEASVLKVAMEELAAEYVTSGVSTETLTRAYQMFVNKYAEGSEEVKKYAAEWQGTMFATFLATIEKYQQLGSATDQAMARSALFGTRLGATLIPVLQTLSKEGLENARQKARELGLVVGEDAVQASQGLAMSTLNLKEAWQEFSAHLSTVAIPVWNAIKGVMAGVIGIANGIARAIGEVTGALSRLAAEGERRKAKLGGDLGRTPLSGYGTEAGVEESPAMPKKDQPGAPPAKAAAGGAGGGGSGSIVSDWQAQLDQLKAEDAAWQDQSLAMTRAFWAEHLASGQTATKEEEEALKAAIEASLREREEKEKEYWTQRLAQCAEGSKDYQEVEHKIVALEQQINKERLQAEISLIKGKIDANQAALKDHEAALNQQMKLDDVALRAQEENLKHRVKMGEISDTEELTQYRTLLAQKLAADLAHEKEIAALYKGDEAAYREHCNKIEVLAQENALKLKQIDDKIEQDSQTDWSKLETTVSSQFRRLAGVLTSGGKGMESALSSVFKDIANDFIEMVEEMIAKWLSFESIISSFQGLFGGGGGFAIGGALSLMGFEQGGIVPSAAGGWEVPRASLALLHPREMVLPADLAGGIRSLVGGGAGGEGAGESHVHFHVSALDGRSVEQFFKSKGPLIMNSIKSAQRGGLRTK